MIYLKDVDDIKADTEEYDYTDLDLKDHVTEHCKIYCYGLFLHYLYYMLVTFGHIRAFHVDAMPPTVAILVNIVNHTLRL